MRKLFFIIFLFSRVYGQNYPNYVPGVLIDKGINFNPSIKPTARLTEYETKFQKGVFLGWNLNSVIPLTGANNTQTTPPGETMPYAGYFNFAKWAQQLKAAGAQWAGISIGTGFGYNLFDSKTTWPGPQTLVTGTGTFAATWPSGLLIPKYTKWDVGQGGNINFFDEFCTEMRKVGIEPTIYIPIHVDLIRLGGSLTDGQPVATQTQYMYYFCCLLQELIIRYKLRYIWLDGTDFVDNPHTGFMQKIYNAVKSVTGQNNPNECLIIANAFPGVETNDWPFDIRSVEWGVWNHTNFTVFKNNMNIRGINYYIPEELEDNCAINNVFYMGYPGVAGYQDVVNRPLTDLQNRMSITKQYYARLSIFFEVSPAGDIGTQQLSLFSNLQ